MLRAVFLAAGSAAAAQAQTLTWFSASDTHLGHDPALPNGTIITSYQKNLWAVNEMNILPGNDTWPASLGGGLVQTPAGVTVSARDEFPALNRTSETTGCLKSVRLGLYRQE